MLFAALGFPEDEFTVAQHCGVTASGCTVQDLVRATQALGLNSELLPVSNEPAAIAALSNLAPFVAMIDLASLYGGIVMLQWHFVVPLGLAQNDVTLHDPAGGPDRHVRLDDFLAAWATSGYRGVRVWIP